MQPMERELTPRTSRGITFVDYIRPIGHPSYRPTMSPLFNFVAKKISSENLSIDLDSLPKPALINYQKCEKILWFHSYFPKLPAIPDECFVFAKDVPINLPRTFERAEKVMDPVYIFMYYIEMGNVAALKPFWHRLDDQQKARVSTFDDKMVQFFAEYLETGVRPSMHELFNLYREAKTRNFNISAVLFKMGPIPFRMVVLLDEFHNTLVCPDDDWEANCGHLAGLLTFKDFVIDFNRVLPSYLVVLEDALRLRYTRFVMLPTKCRIPEVEDFVARRIGPRVC
uniref:Uncharacterized protein n=1 Tax=Steinernema glaseri TaxID=37863 RepID=A0A1I7YDX4_9BILA